MIFSIESILWASTFIFSIYISYLVYRIYSFDRLDKSWLFIVLGFIFIVILRVSSLLQSNGFFPSFFTLWYIYDPLLRIANSVCFIIGFSSMLRNFENFEVVEKKVKGKINGKVTKK
jgi:hypothetical protein